MQNTKQRNLLLIRMAIPLLIAILLSVVITIVNYGFTQNFVGNWSKGVVVAIIIIPLGLRLIPFVAVAVRAVLGNGPALFMRCVVAVCVAIMMEGLVSLAITLVQRGLISGWHLMWGEAFLKSLPIGLLIGFSMTFIVHPWMSRLAASAQDNVAQG